MEDTLAQEKVLALAATQPDLTLKKITEFVEAQEQGSRSSKMLMGGTGNLNRISDYKRSQDQTRPRANTLPAGQGITTDTRAHRLVFQDGCVC